LNSDPVGSARAARLPYINPDGPGIHRERRGRGFVYRRPDGQPVREAATLARIRRLAIPPAWQDVWIGADPSRHGQAWDRDAAGRKQYRYHARWRDIRDTAKYARLLRLAKVLPRLRARVTQDLRRPGLSRSKVLATIVHLLGATMIRVGNEAGFAIPRRFAASLTPIR
jgi:DNA topoisomerase-1